MGTVEHIGVKTTRLRAIGGERLISMQFLQRRPHGIAHPQLQNHAATPRELLRSGSRMIRQQKLEAIPQMIRSIVEGTEDATFARAHFASFAFHQPEFRGGLFRAEHRYDRYMDINQRINLGIKDGFEKLSVSFAFPTSVVQMRPEQI